MNRCDAEEFRRTGGPSAVPFRICCVAALLRAGDREAPVVCAATLPAEAIVRAEPVIVGASE